MSYLMCIYCSRYYIYENIDKKKTYLDSPYLDSPYLDSPYLDSPSLNYLFWILPSLDFLLWILPI